ncbi:MULTISPECIES: histidine kinase [unclassified Microbacterium]|uniref:histidine kinase n=1 Tax=unclassified Microbacterium TaxID=2609290 RepID=UPI0038632639
MQTTGTERTGAAYLALEALGVAALAAWQLVALVSGDTDSIASSVALLALTAVAAAAVTAFAVAVWRGGSWGRSGGIVVQLLILAVAGGSLTGPDGDPATAAAIALPGLVGFVVLIAAARAAAGRERVEPRED